MTTKFDTAIEQNRDRILSLAEHGSFAARVPGLTPEVGDVVEFKAHGEARLGVVLGTTPNGKVFTAYASASGVIYQRNLLRSEYVTLV